MSGCTIDGCGELVLARSMCKKHYHRWHRHGDPRKGMRAPVQQFLAMVLAAPPTDECIFWPFSRNKDGYPHMDRTVAGSSSVCNVICQRVYGPAPTPKHEAAHECGNGRLGCINPKHLRWATHRENMDDAISHGSMNRGETNCNARLTEASIPLIREMRGTPKAIGIEFGVSQATIRAVLIGRTWRWVA